MAAKHDPKWSRTVYWLQKKSSLKDAYLIKDENDLTLGRTNRKALTLKDEIQVFGPDKGNPLEFTIKAQAAAYTSAYTVTDMLTNEVLGVLRQDLIKSTRMRSGWSILSPSDALLGQVAEGSMAGKTTIMSHGQSIGTISKTKKAGRDRWVLECPQRAHEFDPRLLVSALILIALPSPRVYPPV